MTRPMQFNDEGLIHYPSCQRNWTLTCQHPIGEVSLAIYQFSGERPMVHCPNALRHPVVAGARFRDKPNWHFAV